MKKHFEQKAGETSKELRIKFDLEEFLTPYQAIQEVCHRYNIPIKNLEDLFVWVAKGNDIYLVSKKLNQEYSFYKVISRDVPNLVYNSCRAGVFTLHFLYLSEPIIRDYEIEPFDRRCIEEFELSLRDKNGNDAPSRKRPAHFYELALAKEQNLP